MNTNELIYLGIKGRVIGFLKESGAKLWETPLKGSDFVNVFCDGDKLFAHAGGELWCLDPLGGTILWHDGLTGLGYGYVTFASTTAPNNPQVTALLAAIQMEEERRRRSSNVANT